MMVFSPIAIYTTFMAWAQYDLAFYALQSTGVMYIAFLPCVIRFVKRVAIPDGLGDEVDFALNQFIKDVLIIFIVLLCFGYPIVPLQEKQVVFHPACSLYSGPNATAGDTDTSYDETLADVTSTEVRVPMLISLIQNIASSITYGMMKGTGCQETFEEIKGEILSAHISDNMRHELSKFNEQCYVPARLSFINHPPEKDRYLSILNKNGGDKDLKWMGSRVFRHLYYGESYASSPIENFPFKEYSTKSQRESYGDNAPKWGYPSCEQWWSEKIVPTLVDSAVKVGNSYRFTPIQSLQIRIKDALRKHFYSEPDDVIARIIIEESSGGSLNRNDTIFGMGDSKSRSVLAGTLIGMSNTYGNFVTTPVKQESIKQALPVSQALFYFMVVSFAPFLLVLSAFSLRAVWTFVLFLVGAIFINYAWYLVGYASRSIDDVMYSTDGFYATHNLIQYLYIATVPIVFKLLSQMGADLSIGHSAMSNAADTTTGQTESSAMVPVNLAQGLLMNRMTKGKKNG